MNISQTLQSKFKAYPNKKAVIFEEKVVTFKELDRTVNQVSELLRRSGVKKGDRVAIKLSKCLEAVYFHLACTASGAITITLNDGYKPAEEEYFVKDSGSSLFVTDSQNYLKSKEILHKIPGLKIITIDEKFPGIQYYPEEMEGIVSYPVPDYPTKEEDTAMICYTSGTTGKPKGAMITHGNLIENMEDLQEVWRLSDQDILLHTLPLFHAHGLMVSMQGGLYAGATIIMHKKFDPVQVWHSIEKKQCTIFMGVPTMYQRILNAWKELPKKPDISSMRAFISGSAPLSEDLFNQFRDIIGYTILERYGMTEALIITSNPYEVESRKAKSVGYPLPRTAIRIIGQDGKDLTPGEVGEVCIKGGNVFDGYWQNPVKTEESFLDEWFKSGDLGYQDPNDNLRLYLVGRSKELIISGGYNVYPKEVENRLEKHTAVKETAVIGLPDPDFGEKVIAAVVLEDDTEDTEECEDELQAFCRIELANYKSPKKIFFFDQLPKNILGKVLKDEIKKMFS